MNAAEEMEFRPADPAAFKQIGQLLEFMQNRRAEVCFTGLRCHKGLWMRVNGRDRVTLAEGMTEAEIAETLAHEIAHSYLHYDKWDIMNTTKARNREFEEQADRAAKMLLDFLRAVG